MSARAAASTVISVFRSSSPPSNGLQGQQGGHNFGDTGGITLFIGGLLVKHLIGVQVDEKRGGGVHRHGLHPFVLDGAGKGISQAREQ